MFKDNAFMQLITKPYKFNAPKILQMFWYDPYYTKNTICTVTVI